MNSNEISIVADDYVKTSAVNPDVDHDELVERISVVSDEMGFLAKLLMKYNGPSKKKYIKHAQELLGASVMLRGWGIGIMEERNEK